MNRRDFLKLGGVSLAGVSLFSQFINANQTQFSVAELMGKGKIPLTGKSFLLRKEAGEAFLKMSVEALKYGIKIYSQSSFRSFDKQNQIWTRKYNRFVGQGLTPVQAIDKIIEYSTIPGTSRHHWGTDLDIIDRNQPIPKSLLVESNSQKGGAYEKLYQWMQANSERFGFYEVYTDNHDTRKGFHYEPWHYSYKPLSQQIFKEYLKIDIKSELKKYKLLGIEHFSDSFLEKYIKENIKGINPDLL